MYILRSGFRVALTAVVTLMFWGQVDAQAGAPSPMNPPCQTQGAEILYGFATSRLNLAEAARIDLCTGAFHSAGSGSVPFFANSPAVATRAGFLYVSNSFIDGGQGSGSQILAYSIDRKNGSIAQIPGSPYFFPSPTSIQGLATSPDGNFLYGADDSGNIFAFTLDSSTGEPTSVPGSPLASGANSQLVVDPSGKFLYATDDDAKGSVLAFAIASDGALTPLSGSPFVIATTSDGLSTEPYGLVDTGHFLYVALSGTNEVAAFAVNRQTGALTHVPGSPFAAGDGASYLARLNDFLYVVNPGDGTVSAYTINSSTGALTPIAGSPFGSGGETLALDASGQYLYLGTFRGVQGYNINPATGALTLGLGNLEEEGVLDLTIVGRQ